MRKFHFNVGSRRPVMVTAVMVSVLALVGGVASATTNYQFQVDQGQSNLTANVTVYYDTGSILGTVSASDSGSSPISGTINASLTPGTSPFSMIQVTAMNLALTNTLNLNFSFLGGLATEDVAASNVSLSMLTAGSPASVDGSGNFTQSNNNFGVSGHMVATGVVTQTADVTNQPTGLQSLSGNVSQSGQTVALGLTINQTVSGIDLGSGTTADIVLTGNVVGTATAVVPEPASASLIILGGLGLLIRRRRHVA